MSVSKKRKYELSNDPDFFKLFVGFVIEASAVSSHIWNQAFESLNQKQMLKMPEWIRLRG